MWWESLIQKPQEIDEQTLNKFDDKYYEIFESDKSYKKKISKTH